MVFILKPALGTSFSSMPPRLPINKISALGCFSRKYHSEIARELSQKDLPFRYVLSRLELREIDNRTPISHSKMTSDVPP